jgi:hypothetical protein
MIEPPGRESAAFRFPYRKRCRTSQKPERNIQVVREIIEMHFAGCTSAIIAANALLAAEGAQEEPVFSVPREGLFARG